jgi:hypothetical protein
MWLFVFGNFYFYFYFCSKPAKCAHCLLPVMWLFVFGNFYFYFYFCSKPAECAQCHAQHERGLPAADVATVRGS